MKIIDIPQQGEAWFKIRAGRPTASNFDRIITATGKDSSQWPSYATELTQQSAYRDLLLSPSFNGNHDTDRGNELEPLAREEFARIMGLEVRQVGFVTNDDGIIGCSPDGLIYHNGTPVAGLEIKCPRPEKHGIDLVEGTLRGVMPSDHKPQVHGSMAVTGLSVWYFMSYCPPLPPLILKVTRDEYTAKVSDALDRFLMFYAEHRKVILPILTGKGVAA